jgi:hypothetical protein
VKLVLDQHVASPLTGPIVEPIERVDTPDERTAVVVMKEPWSAFPAVLTGQIGMVPAPSQLNTPQGVIAVGTGHSRSTRGSATASSSSNGTTAATRGSPTSTA